MVLGERNSQQLNMRRFFVLICSLGLVCAAHGGKQQGKTATNANTSKRVSTKSPQHVQAKSPQHVAAEGTHHVAAPATRSATSNAHVQHSQPTHNNAGIGHPSKRGGQPGPTEVARDTENPGSRTNVAKPAASVPPTPVYHYNFRTKSGLIGRDFARPLTPDERSAIARQVENEPPEGTHGAHGAHGGYENGAYHYDFRTKSGLIGRDFAKPLTPDEQSAIARQIENEPSEGTWARSDARSPKANVSRRGPRQFKLPNKPNPAIVGTKFEGTGHIPGSETWTDPKYGAFRDYRHQWHDKDWWEHHCDHTHDNRPSVPIVLVYGGWYWWHAGYWYPAWGYDRQNSYYPYDGPIYAYSGLAPDQVVANVQAALQALGYYLGPIDGLLGAATQEAIANYQRDHGLYTTSAIDEPTLAELGMS
jgi:N-acetylmuramoyl-L-alanine amidase